MQAGVGSRFVRCVLVGVLNTSFGYLIGRLIFGRDWPAGFAATTVPLSMSILLNAMFLGNIGEAIGRILVQTKQLNISIVGAGLSRGDADLAPAAFGAASCQQAVSE